ncbi:hypothetical protein AMK16_25465 [Streptomyces sp. CB00455]|nr:hypothetical protein AMK16_25465 [Streptomyces sp. CB00455]
MGPPPAADLPGLLRRFCPGEEPLLLCVDDVHLWDAPSRAVLTSAARHPDPERPIGLLLTTAEHRADEPEFTGLPVVRLGPLDDAAATALLHDLAGAGVDPCVRSELLSEAEGNPAVLAALAQRLTPDELGGHRPLPRPLLDGGALWATFGSRLAPLPNPTRQLLLLAAAAHEPDPGAGGADASLALARHETAHGDFERARTLLLYGKWLRRRRRPAEAKSRLRDALVAFERCGAPAWAEQTRGELRATGDASAPAPAGALARLTPQQLRIARCVAEGATNREVALSLSVSPRTVDHHLRNVFALLGVRSRTELSRLLHRAEGDGAGH